MKKILFTIVCLMFAGAAFAQTPAETCACDCCKGTEKCVCCEGGQDCECECCKNSEVCTCECCNKKAASVLRATPAYDEPGQIVEAIVAQYPGKIVLVDLWATWCTSCLAAMKTMEPIKPWLKEHDVVFVYLSMHNSDPAKYGTMAEEIGGEHYLLKDKAEEDAMFAHLGRTGLPTYFIFDREGKLARKQVGYKMLGNDGLKAEVEKLQ